MNKEKVNYLHKKYDSELIESSSSERKHNNFYFICRKCLTLLSNKKDTSTHICQEEKEEVKKYRIEFEEKYISKREENKVYKENLKLKEKILELENIIKYKDNKFESIRSILLDSSDKKTPKTSPERKKKDHFISADKITAVVSEKTEEEKKNIIYSIEQNLEEIGKKYFDEPEEELKKSIINLLKNFETDKNINIFSDIREKRKKILKYINLDNYIKMIEEHHNKFIKFIESKKMNYLKNKCVKFFSSFECRLVFSKMLNDTPVDNDDLDRFHIGLEFHTRIGDFKEYNKEDIVKKILNADLCYNNIKQVLKRELINKSSFNNIIFSELNQNKSKHSDPNDPFAFYILEKIEKTKRSWKMDWKLQEFSAFIANSISNYCISLFRKLYHLVFGDNSFREDYLLKSVILEAEGEQILQNILTVNNYYKFSESILQLIKENATYASTTNDKFNIYSDDKEASKIYKDLVNYNYDNDTLEVFGQLFDNSDPIEIERFYRLKKNL